MIIQYNEMIMRVFSFIRITGCCGKHVQHCCGHSHRGIASDLFTLKNASDGMKQSATAIRGPAGKGQDEQCVKTISNLKE